MNVAFLSEQFAQLFELFFLVNLLGFFAALVVRLFSPSISDYSVLFPRKIDYFRMNRFVRKAHRHIDFEDYYKHVKFFIRKSCE